jgi:microcystin synthetase protein McyB
MTTISASSLIKPTLLQNFFENQVLSTPDNIALLYHSKKLTYRELENLSNQLAHYIVDRKLPNESLIPVAFHDPINYVIAILAVLKSGHCYVPLSPNVPKERLTLMLNQLDYSFLLTDFSIDYHADAKESLLFNELVIRIKNHPLEKPILSAPHALAYMIFTSGSTGTPKGVLMEHHGPVNIIEKMDELSSLNKNEFFIQNVNFGFDPHIWTLFWPLSVGATVILQNEFEQHDAGYMLDLIKQYQIRVLHAGVSLTKALLKLPAISECHSLKQIIGGGEAWSIHTVNELFGKLAHCELVNVYGPTETCVHAAYWRSRYVKKIGEIIPIGKPVSNYQIYILDENLQTVASGEKGQIGIGGIGVASGYYKDEALTAKKFIPNPLNKNDFIYLSGDVGLVNQDGDIEFYGRTDEQVQIRGHRIELGEVENALMKNQNVDNAIALATEINSMLELIAFVSLKETEANDKIISQEINAFLKDKIPSYMLPKQYVFITEWPLTNNGKVDKKRLLNMLAQQPSAASLPPDNSIENKIISIWSAVLNLSNIQKEDDFFQIGGDSLNAIDIIAKINESLIADFSLSLIFDNPALGDFIEFILANSNQSRSAQSVETIPTTSFNLSLNQKRLLRSSGRRSALNNGIIPLKLTGQINIANLKKSVRLLIKNHEILRAQLAVSGDKMVIVDEVDDAFVFENLFETSPQTASFNTAFGMVVEYLETEVDIVTQPLLQIILIQYNSAEYLLLVNLNHIIADSFTGKFIVENILQNYQNLQQNISPIACRFNQFQHYISLEEKIYQSQQNNTQINFWHSLLLNHPRSIQFIAQESRDLAAGFTNLILDKSKADTIRKTAFDSKVSLFTTLITLLAKSLYDYQNQQRFVLGFTFSIRDKPEFQNMLGPLSNKLLLPFDFRTTTDFEQSLKNVGNLLIEIYKNGDIQLEVLRDSIKEVEGDAFTELFNIIFDYEKEMVKQWQLEPDALAETVPMVESSQVKRHLSIRVMDNEETLVFNIRYRKTIFSEHAIIRLKDILLQNIKTLKINSLQEETVAC